MRNAQVIFLKGKLCMLKEEKPNRGWTWDLQPPPRRGSSPPLSPCEGSLPDPPSAEGTEAQASALLGRLRLLRGETGFDGVFGPQNATSSPENAICLWTPAPRFLWIVRPNPELVCSRKNPNVARKNSNDS